MRNMDEVWKTAERAYGRISKRLREEAIEALGRPRLGSQPSENKWLVKLDAFLASRRARGSAYHRSATKKAFLALAVDFIADGLAKEKGGRQPTWAERAKRRRELAKERGTLTALRYKSADRLRKAYKAGLGEWKKLRSELPAELTESARARAYEREAVARAVVYAQEILLAEEEYQAERAVLPDAADRAKAVDACAWEGIREWLPIMSDSPPEFVRLAEKRLGVRLLPKSVRNSMSQHEREQRTRREARASLPAVAGGPAADSGESPRRQASESGRPAAAARSRKARGA